MTTQHNMIAARRRQRIASARRFTLVGLVLAAVGLLVATSVTFTATNGNTTLTINKTETTIGDVHSQGNDTLNTDGAGVTAIVWPAAAAAANSQGTPAVWSPIEGQSVAVTTSGDIAVIDARGLAGNVFITLTITNAASLAGAYSYFILPVEIEVYSGSGGTWNPASNADSGPTITTQYLTLSSGFITFLVDGGKVYGLTIPIGGSIYTVNDAGTLGPTFHVTTTPS